MYQVNLSSVNLRKTKTGTDTGDKPVEDDA